MAVIVQKFGGTSVRDVEHIRRVAGHAIREAQAGNRVVVVLSAMGDTTDRLVAMAKELMPEPSAREYDMLLASGEQISISLLALAIHAAGCDAKSFTGSQIGIRTDSAHGRARIVHISDEKIREALDAGNVVIVAGFQGVTGDQEITTLGRGGSDTTAVALAAALKADRCDIYTDVEGVYTADPRIVPKARRLDKITYDEMLELASLGAKVLHNRSVELAKNYAVRLRVLSSLRPGPGTLVVQEYEDMEKIIVSGVTLDTSESKISIIGVPDRPGIAATIFSRLAEEDVSVDMIIQNVASHGKNDISFTVKAEDFARAKKLSDQLAKELEAGKVETEEGIAKISVVGVGMRSHSGVAAKLFRAFAEAGVSIKSITTSEISISCVIDVDLADKAVQAAHDAFDLGAEASD